MTAALLVTPALAHAETWTSLEGSGYRNPGSSTFPSTDLSPAWTGSPVSGSIGEGPSTRSCVLVDEARVYAVHHDVEEPHLAALVALERDTGEVAWQSEPFVHAPVDCPVLAGGMVVAATGYSQESTDRPGLRALDAATGEESWTQPLTSGMISSALSSDGTHVYASGHSDDCSSFDVHTAWDLTTGERVWCVRGSQTEEAPVVADGAVVVGNRSGPGLTALSAEDGSTLWSDPEAMGPHSVAADGTQVAYGLQRGFGDYRLRLRPAASGEGGWTSAPTGDPVGRVVMDGQRVYGSHSLLNGGDLRLRAYTRSDGSPAWPSDVQGSPFQRENMVLLGDTVAAGSVFADRATGDSAEGYWWHLLPQRPAFADGTVFGWVQNADDTWSVTAVRDTTAPILGALTPAADVSTSDTTPTFTHSAADGDGRGVTELVLTLDGRRTTSPAPRRGPPRLRSRTEATRGP